ncbi:MAG: anti-sigma factor family protein [Thermodesulfobacteriota bacterium]
MLECLRYRKRLNAFLDKELSEREQSLVERHLTQCASCRAVLDDLQELAPLLASLPTSPVPPFLTARIQTAAQARQKQVISGSFSRWWREIWTMQPLVLKGATAAALVIGLTMGSYLGWASFRIDLLAPSEVTVCRTEIVDGPLYAFQSLGTAPQGSMVAATLALMDYDGRVK